MSDTADCIVVVGSGPCGAIAASELVGAGRRVVMLEAGTALPRGIIVRAAGHTLARWRTMDQLSTQRHVPVGDPETEWQSALSPGGLSNYWTAAVPRYAPEDFTDGAVLDERYRWPVSYEDLVPYYELAEGVLSISGPTTSIPVLPAGRTRYAVHLPPDWERIATSTAQRSLTVLPVARGRRWMVARRGSEFNSYHVIVKPLESSAEFELRQGARATSILLDEGTGAVSGVAYHDVALGCARVVRCRAVIVAAGAIDSASLLLRSRSPAAPAGIGNDAGLVGTHLHDHPREWWRAELAKPMRLLDHPAYLARAPYKDSQPFQGASATIGLAGGDRFKALRHGTGMMLGVQVLATMEPRPDGVMRLSADRYDDDGAPLVEIDVRYDDAVRRSLAAARVRFTEELASVGAKVIPQDWRPRPGSSVHYAGVARMHARRDLGVVDGWNRVHDTPSVVVADLACFTTNPEKNPTLTAMALAARAARRLAADVAP